MQLWLYTLAHASSFGVRENSQPVHGYVVRDIEAAMWHWIDVLGVGPWFYIEHLPVSDFQYKGQPSPVDLDCPVLHVRGRFGMSSMIIGPVPSLCTKRLSGNRSWQKSRFIR